MGFVESLLAEFTTSSVLEVFCGRDSAFINPPTLSHKQGRGHEKTESSAHARFKTAKFISSLATGVETRD